MLAGRIHEATRVLGAPKNWDEATDGPCCGLAVKDMVSGGLSCMVSAWEPTPEEMKRIADGLPVHLWIYGISHPVVALSVGEYPQDGEEP
jgi:hypothetical protein